MRRLRTGKTQINSLKKSGDEIMFRPKINTIIKEDDLYSNLHRSRNQPQTKVNIVIRNDSIIPEEKNKNNKKYQDGEDQDRKAPA